MLQINGKTKSVLTARRSAQALLYLLVSRHTLFRDLCYIQEWFVWLARTTAEDERKDPAGPRTARWSEDRQRLIIQAKWVLASSSAPPNNESQCLLNFMNACRAVTNWDRQEHISELPLQGGKCQNSAPTMADATRSSWLCWEDMRHWLTTTMGDSETTCTRITFEISIDGFS